ncbi:hypothetical protein E0W80_09470 [Microbacterium sp. PI-1]|uniref:hypothetical protein n=1 Tax=unclassified Microbacterium TaxID=2609290 RepID=UPI001040300E|nr:MULTISPECIES: hypothetical protein [unclassified Microbacterium]TCJ23779.1 hypothetical protein E0W80_09470 [Microbacterium sp. PI-1]UUE20083.1 hypothetical protein LRQ07_14990 [Microbacterium sp. J1-1]
MYHLAYHADAPVLCPQPEACGLLANRHVESFEAGIALRHRLLQEGGAIPTFNKDDLPMLDEWARTGVSPFKF